MNLTGRVIKTIADMAKTVDDLTPGFIDVWGVAGKFAKPVVEGGLKGGINVANKLVGGIVKANENKVVRKIGKATAKTTGYAAAEVKNVGSGINKAANILKGKEMPRLNKVVGDVTGKDFNGKKWGAMIKESEDSIMFGHKATALGSTVLVGVGLSQGVLSAGKEFNKERQGINVGSAMNAPINNYAVGPTMGNSYANNAGATGDLAFALHNQRKTGIL